MAFSRKNARAALTTGAATIYTVPASKVALIMMIQIANIDGANAATATVQWTDASSGSPADVTRLCYVASVAAGDALAVPAGGLILEAGDTIEALASANGDLELTLCYQEFDV